MPGGLAAGDWPASGGDDVVILVLAMGVALLLSTAAVIDLRARRRGRRIRLQQADINRGRQAQIDELNKHAPSGYYLQNRFGPR